MKFTKFKIYLLSTLLSCFILGINSTQAAASISGELKMWHKVTLTFDGPNTSETATPNPFTNYRLNVTFTHSGSGTTLLVPGYYATDGNAANTSASSGNKWRVHLSPSATGTWTYTVSFRTGTDIHADDSPTAGSSAGFMDGETGSFNIGATDKTGRDLRGKGWLQWVGGRYLKFKGTGEYLIKQGTDSPENFLRYNDFDGTSDRKSYSVHLQHWNTGDPTWSSLDGKSGIYGKAIIGAINYLSGKGLNSFSFIPMSAPNGDDSETFPYINKTTKDRIDVSKVAQWEILFEYATKKGMFLHFKTQETENQLYLDGGAVGRERKLYYRELIARFGHNPALNWNLGEENGEFSYPQTTQQRKDMAQYFWDHDPYTHHIVLHNGIMPKTDGLYGSNSKLTGWSLQDQSTDFSGVPTKVKQLIDESAAAGRPYAVSADETGGASNGIKVDGSNWDNARKNGLWGNLLVGGWGNEWYSGGEDQSLEDFTTRSGWWDLCRYALEFFNNNNIPVQNMINDNNLSSNTNDWCLYQAGNTYVVYLKSGGTTNLNLSGASGTFNVKWYDPRNGGTLQNGSVAQVTGGGNPSLGNAPNNTTSDWVILVTSGTPVSTYTLNTIPSTGGTISPVSGNFAQNSTITVTAIPASGYVFNKWVGALSDSTNPTSLLMNSDKTISASFSPAPAEAIPWVENFTKADGITSDVAPTSWTATNISVLSNEMAFNNVGVDGVFTTSPIDISSGPVTVKLKVRGGTGLDVGQDFLRLYKKVDGGAEVLVGAANGPQTEATWTDDITSGSNLVLVIRAHVTATSEFYYFDDLSVTSSGTTTQYRIIAIAANNGSINPSGTVMVNSGTNQSFTITPDANYTVEDVRVDGANLGAITSYTFSNVTADHTIDATFKVLTSTIDAYTQIEAESYSSMSGIQAEPCSEGGQNIGWIENGDYIAFYNVDFGTGAAGFEARVASGGAGGSIEIRIDNQNGSILGTCNVSQINGWQSWYNANCSVTNLSGIKNLYLVFKGGSGYLLNLNWFKFIKNENTNLIPNGTYSMKSKSGAYLTATTSIGAIKSQATENGNYTKWVFNHLGSDVYEITSAQFMGERMEIPYAAATAGSLAAITNYTGLGTHLQWKATKLNGFFLFEPMHALGMALDAWADNPNVVHLWGKDLVNNNQWYELINTSGVALKSAFDESKVSELEKKDDEVIFVYPNPVSKTLNIEHANGATIRILNLQGQIVYNTIASNSKSSIEISEINANGLVFVQVLSGNKTNVFKVTIEK